MKDSEAYKTDSINVGDVIEAINGRNIGNSHYVVIYEPRSNNVK